MVFRWLKPTAMNRVFIIFAGYCMLPLAKADGNKLAVILFLTSLSRDGY